MAHDDAPLSHAEFERLVEEHAGRLYSVALRITGNPQDAEDVTQEAFLQAFRKAQTFRGEASPATWLYRICVNAALMRIRGRPAEYLSDTAEDVLPIVDWTESQDEALLNAELRAEIERALQLLSPDDRAVVVLRDVEGLSTHEAADVLGISEAALKSRLHRARLLLRRHLEQYLRER